MNVDCIAAVLRRGAQSLPKHANDRFVSKYCEELMSRLEKLVSFATCSRTWVDINNFEICPEMMGSSLKFECVDRQVEIAIPKLSADECRSDENGNDKISFHKWREPNGMKIPLEFDVHKVAINISIPEKLTLPREILNLPNNAYELLSLEEQKFLEELAGEQEGSGTVIHATGTRPVSVGQWPEAETALNEGMPPPVYLSYFLMGRNISTWVIYTVVWWI